MKSRNSIVILTLLLGFPAAANAQSLEAESSMQIPRAVVKDSGTPAAVVGQAFFSGGDNGDVQVVLKYGSCPVPLAFYSGRLLSSLGGYFTTDDCTGTPYLRRTSLAESPFGASCGYFLVNASNQVFQVLSSSGTVGVTFESRWLAGTCDSTWGPEGFTVVQTSTPAIGDLDALFTPPFKVVQ